MPAARTRGHKRGIPADPLRGLFETTFDGLPAVVAYEPDPDPRDGEIIPLLCPEVLPCPPDAWYQPDSAKTGYEISFSRYF